MTAAKRTSPGRGRAEDAATKTTAEGTSTKTEAAAQPDLARLLLRVGRRLARRRHRRLEVVEADARRRRPLQGVRATAEARRVEGRLAAAVHRGRPLQRRLAEAARVLRPGGSLFIYGSPAKLWIARLKLIAADECGLEFNVSSI